MKAFVALSKTAATDPTITIAGNSSGNLTVTTTTGTITTLHGTNMSDNATSVTFTTSPCAVTLPDNSPTETITTYADGGTTVAQDLTSSGATPAENDSTNKHPLHPAQRSSSRTAQRILSLLLLFLAVACVVLIIIIELPTAPPVNSAPENSTAELKGSSVTAMKDGRLLISGGTGDDEMPRPIVQIFKNGSVSTVQPLITARTHHASVTLNDGRVLVLGGSTTSGATADTETYDSQTNEWHKQASMSNRRMDLTATLLPDGRVLVAGGSGSTAAGKSVEIYDPKTDRFFLAGQLTMARAKHTAGISQGGKVIIRGGVDTKGKELDTAEVFDPVKGVSTLDQSTVRRRDPRASEMSLFSLLAYIKNYWMPADGGTR